MYHVFQLYQTPACQMQTEATLPADPKHTRDTRTLYTRSRATASVSTRQPYSARRQAAPVEVSSRRDTMTRESCSRKGVLLWLNPTGCERL